MNVFADQKRTLKPQQPEPPGTRVAGTVLLISLLMGSGLVAWRTLEDTRTARITAATEARAMALAIEMQLRQAATAVETLAAAARQSGGSIPGFQALATSLLASRPGIASIELQPAGIVTDVVPRAGNERVIGVNVLNDPRQRAAANEAMRRNTPAVLGGARLHNGEPGIIARAALFQKGRDGRESFWGLVAASVRLKDLTKSARLEGLWNQGYGYSLFIPGGPNLRAEGLLLRGEVSLGSAVQHPFKIHNLQLALAVEPQGGWINKRQLALEVALILVLSGLIWVGARLLESKRAMSLELVELQQRAELESRERVQAEQETRAALQTATNREADLKKAQSAIQQAEAARTESAAQLENQLRLAEHGRESAEAKAQVAERTISEMADQLAAANRAGQEAAKAHGAAQDQIQARLKKATDQVAELQRRLEEAGRGRQEALAESLKQAAESEKTLSELRTRLETVEKSSRHLEQVHTARIGDLEARNRELTARLKHLEAAEERVAELTALLKESHAQQEAGRNVLESSGESAPEAPTELEAEVTSDDPPAAAARPTVREIADSDEPPANLIAGPVPEPLPKDSSAKAEPAAEAVKPTPAAEPPGPVTTAPPAKAGRRKKARRDPQMDLFAGSNATNDDFERPTVVAVDKDVAEAWPIELETEPSEVSEPNHNPEAATEPDTAPSAESKGADVLPEIKGLLVADGIAWAGGNPRIFLKSLREFSQQHTGTGDKIRAALEQGDAVAAEQMARGLKSSAGDIGASTLAESATTLARAIHDHAEPGDLEAAWSEVESQLHDLLIEIKTALKPKEEKAATRRLPAPPPLDAAQFRKAINLILPLLADSDPGARDCLKDNRNTFRSGFSPEGYADFELWVKKGDFGEALESLKKAARKHGLPV